MKLDSIEITLEHLKSNSNWPFKKNIKLIQEPILDCYYIHGLMVDNYITKLSIVPLFVGMIC